MRHTWKETLSGLKRNLTMTIAVIVTMWVSLTLFGLGVLANEQVDLAKGKWYDKVEVTVYLCSPPLSKAATCDPGQSPTEGQKRAIEEALKGNPEVKSVFYESKREAYEEFQRVYKDSPYRGTLTEDQMSEAFRVKLKNPQEYQSVKSSVDGLKGVDYVQDLHSFLDPLFRVLNLAQWATIGASLLLLLAAALQIVNTIRMTAFARRRELGIMRLVGASNLYVMLPFLLEALVAAAAGVLLAGATMCGLVALILSRKGQFLTQQFQWIGWPETGIAIGWVAVVGLVLSVLPTLIATRRYLRV